MTKKEARRLGIPVTEIIYRNKKTEIEVGITANPDGTFDLEMSRISRDGVGTGYSIDGLTTKKIREIANRILEIT